MADENKGRQNRPAGRIDQGGYTESALRGGGDQGRRYLPDDLSREGRTDYGGYPKGALRQDEGRERGPFRGHGPRGYTRSDQRIQEDVNDRLTEDDHLDATEITVGVSNGEVTLDGTVGSRGDKRRAEDIAEDVSGVQHVQNNLRIRQ